MSKSPDHHITDVIGPDPALSGVILAGGGSTRLGRDKALLELEGRTLVARTLDALARLTDDLIVVTNLAPRLLPSLARVVADRYVGAGVLAGVHAGLLAARGELAIVVACDMPFLNLDLLRHLISLAQEADVVVPRWTDVEPLHAVYRPAACLGPVERALARGERRIVSFYHEVRVRHVERAEIARFGPQGLSFFNVNTAEDWKRALACFGNEAEMCYTPAMEGVNMKLRQILSIIDGKAISRSIDLDEEVQMGCGSDLMSDVLAFTREGALLMTGLTNPQVVRTAELAGIAAIVFVRGKLPPPETVALAEEKGIPLLTSRYTMFETCGRLYQAGLPGCGLFEITLRQWHLTFGDNAEG